MFNEPKYSLHIFCAETSWCSNLKNQINDIIMENTSKYTSEA